MPSSSKRRERGASVLASPSDRRPPSPARKTPETISADEGATPSTFPIVGLGASAGGLEALEQFLRNVPEESGMGFVIVQHLDPTHKGAMVELLQRTTRMRVLQIEDRVAIAPTTST